LLGNENEWSREKGIPWVRKETVQEKKDEGEKFLSGKKRGGAGGRAAGKRIFR